MPDFQCVNGRLHHYRFRPGRAAPAIVFANSLGTDLRIWDHVIEVLPTDLPIVSHRVVYEPAAMMLVIPAIKAPR